MVLEDKRLLLSFQCWTWHWTCVFYTLKKVVLNNADNWFVLHILEVRKVLTFISKLKDCAEVSDWIQPCINHLFWSAISTPSGDGNLIWAKFKSFLFHIINKHTGLDNPLFNECAHEENIAARKWLQKGLYTLTLRNVHCRNKYNITVYIKYRYFHLRYNWIWKNCSSIDKYTTGKWHKKSIANYSDKLYWGFSFPLKSFRSKDESILLYWNEMQVCWIVSHCYFWTLCQ